MLESVHTDQRVQVRFGECVFDPEARQILRAGASVHLTPKAFELLQILVESRPKAMSRASIQDRLWPSLFVSRTSLPSLVAELRAALGDDARRPRYIRTVYGYGYAFVGSAPRAEEQEPHSSGRRCRLLLPDREVVLQFGEHVLGRAQDAAVWLDSTSVSRRHARLSVSDARVVIEDLGSRNGTFVGGVSIDQAVTLADGDRVRLGAVEIIVRLVPDSHPTKPLAES